MSPTDNTDNNVDAPVETADARPRLTDRQQLILTYIAEQITRQGYAPSVREIGAAASIPSISTVHGELRRLENYGYLRRDPAKPRAMVILRNEKAAKTPLEAVAAASGDIPLAAPPGRPTEAPDGPFFSSPATALPFVPFADLPAWIEAHPLTAAGEPATDQATDQRMSTINDPPPHDIGAPGDIRASGDIGAPAKRGLADGWLAPAAAFGPGSYFMTAMPDDSLINRQIQAGDLLILRRQDTAANGDLILGRLSDQVLARVYFKGLRQIRLQAENDGIQPLTAALDALRIWGRLLGFIRRF
ncbi:MAG: hypothetical protein LBK98_07565 [Peptococcaceae bacterium]|jgi:repressor LexA|nr:hypothetical protein [Peptococcaceae bacterium]